MKYLLVLAVVVIAFYLWRQARVGNDRPGGAPGAGAAPGAPQDMVRCPVCAVHLPRADAVEGAGGALYCSDDHRRQRGG